MTRCADIEAVNAMDTATFVSVFGGVYEHTPQVATGVLVTRPFVSRQHLFAAMSAVVDGFTQAEKLQLVLEHPRLGKRDGLTTSSEKEQASIGLDKLENVKALELAQLNDDYFERFQFPFIVAVKLLQGRDVATVIEERLLNDREAEFSTALSEIDKIAGVRLEQLVSQ